MTAFAVISAVLDHAGFRHRIETRFMTIHEVLGSASRKKTSKRRNG